ncbi:MBL fold metallo-hydrolase RNA specificity domain-containing protein [Caminibacter pacificus]|uniref:MBL fold metallo-hydrolase n=1 Tax=Caminibacter pacificus TaxID=1424653 RepID=A0AAJ4RE51_9BACT|nr:MBL fold metallo-hydrolase [Caminibacter pacificus]NPA88424.1 MBL fold metallo-hydrolase [Campylobacterota bacterium]QCI28248.1 MBL fold metallo-hydrolase [Caminibacter pacificus]ROR41038.1 metallo-beta-lactamase family protein [Caminibacter pacificus]
MKQSYEQSFGAAKIVTGSAHMLDTGNSKILIDCGMFQGLNEHLNYDPLGFDPKEIDALIITHGHLDHVGRIPLLYKYGFKGKVFAHPATFDIAKVVLMDSAKLQEEDYETRFRKAQRRGKEHLVRKPLYTRDDVKAIFKKMDKVKIDYDKKIKITKDIKAVFKDAGHILGSSFVELEFENLGIKKHIVFSGDLGNKDNEVLPPPQKPTIADALFIESTYGDRNHKSFEESKIEFKKVIIDTLLSGGNVIIPTFAIERAQQVLCLLKEMSEEGSLPREAKVFLDSPMANKVTAVYKKWSHLLSKNCQKYKKHPFEFPQLRLVKDVEESKKINEISRGAVIIAGSGMCTGGRILHHLKHRIWNPKNSVLFVGYQAKGTMGRDIVDGAKFIKIFHEEIIVRAKIHTINGFSAHADQKELLEWMNEFDNLDRIFLIHGEYEKQVVFKSVIRNFFNKKAHIVDMGEKIYL